MFSFPEGKSIYLRFNKLTTMKNVFVFPLFIFVFASGCVNIGGIRGSGEIITEARNVSSFTNIHASGAIDVYIKQDSVSSVKVETDDNLMQYVEVHTEGSTLEIHTRHNVNINPSEKIKVYITNPSYKGFKISGASGLIAENRITSSEMLSIEMSGASEGRLDIDAPKVAIDISGASNIIIQGKTKDLEAGASGASKIRCFELLAENTNVDVSGASHAEVFASVKIIPHASGASSIDYKGNATVEDKKENGASSVNKKD